MRGLEFPLSQPDSQQSKELPLTRSNDSYPNRSVQDRVRFLVFVSWWTVVFSAAYIAVFFVAAGSFLASIASHSAWVILT